MTVFLPEFTATGLALWRLRRSPAEQVWCSVHYPHGDDELVLIVQDQATEQPVLEESHLSLVQLMERAENVRKQFMTEGWQLVDVDLDEPD